MANPYIGQIIAAGFSFAPVGWLSCDGTLVSIQEYPALYALIGTTYGGDGTTTFALPNLNGRVAIGQGQGPNRPNYAIGEAGGSETVTLVGSQVGTHRHRFMASAKPGTTDTPAVNPALAENTQVAANLYAPGPAAMTLRPDIIQPVGQGRPHENRQPYQVINYIIAYDGVFPSQA